MASEDPEGLWYGLDCPLTTEVGPRPALYWFPLGGTLSFKSPKMDVPSPEQVPVSPVERTVL